MILKHDKHGYHNATGSEVESMKKNGWYEITIEQRLAEIANKGKIVDNDRQSKDVIEGSPARPSGEQPAKRRGRPPR